MDTTITYDEIGDYAYRAGYCVRDAFCMAFGPYHPLVSHLNMADIPFGTLFTIFDWYGLRRIHRGAVPLGPAVYFLETALDGYVHAVYLAYPNDRLRSRSVLFAVVWDHVEGV